MALLTRKMHDIEQMKEVKDNVEIVEAELSHDFKRIFCEFKRANEEVVQYLREEEKEDDQSNWYKPKCDAFEGFIVETGEWVSETRQILSEEEDNDDIMPEDSVAAVLSLGAKSTHGFVAQSTTSCVCV